MTVPSKVAIAALLAAAWAGAGAAPFRDAVTGAPDPVDFARDYVTAHARAHLGRGAPPVGEAGNVYGATLGAPGVVLLGGPYFIHPPPAVLAVLPLVPLGWHGASWAWLALSIVALFILARALVEAAGFEDERVGPRAALLGLLLLAWPPVLHNFAKGQWSLVLAALMAEGWRALRRERPRAAGICFGLAASLKVTPVLLLGYLALRHRRAAVAMLATGVAACAASIALSGWAPWAAWLADAPGDVAAWQTWTANTVSLGGAIGRLVAGGPYARGLVEQPGLSRALVGALSLALVAYLARVTRGAPRTPSHEGALFAAWGALVVVLNPIAWTHTSVMALLPLALVLRRHAPAALFALIVMTIPRETLTVLAGPIPVAPGPGLWLSLHAAAVLIVFAAAVRVVSARSSTDSAAPLPTRSP